MSFTYAFLQWVLYVKHNLLVLKNVYLHNQKCVIIITLNSQSYVFGTLSHVTDFNKKCDKLPNMFSAQMLLLLLKNMKGLVACSCRLQDIHKFYDNCTSRKFMDFKTNVRSAIYFSLQNQMLCFHFDIILSKNIYTSYALIVITILYIIFKQKVPYRTFL